MDSWEILGFMAATAGAISLLPEVMKALRTHHLRDLAWGMLLLSLFASTAWLMYGIHLHNLPMIFSPSVNVVMEVTLIFLKLHYSKHRKPIMLKNNLIDKAHDKALETEAVLNKGE